MATRTRRTHAAVFNANVALAAMGGDKTLAELAQRFEGHPHQITEWKRQLSERAAEIFGGGAASTEPPVDLKAVHAKIGQLTLENDFLEGALIKVGWLSATRRLTATTHCRLAARHKWQGSAEVASTMCPNLSVRLIWH